MNRVVYDSQSPTPSVSASAGSSDADSGAGGAGSSRPGISRRDVDRGASRLSPVPRRLSSRRDAGVRIAHGER